MLQILHGGRPFEIRIIQGRRIRSGYFDDIDAAVRAIRPYERRANIYVTMNAIDAALMSRAHNRIADRPKATTGDADVIALRWLLIDADARRPSGISASAAEQRAAIERRDAVRAYLGAYGWQAAIVGMSGNGGHLLYPLADLPNDDEHVGLVRDVLETLNGYLGDDQVDIDTTVYNPSRITKLLGTTAVKGDDTVERPHRASRIDEADPEAGALDAEDLREVIDALGGDNPAPARANGHRAAAGGGYTRDMIAAALDDADIGYTEKSITDGVAFILDRCLTSDAHNDGARVILTTSGPEKGKAAYVCHHDSCSDKRWSDVRAQLGIEAPTAGVAPINVLSGAQLVRTVFPALVWLVDGLLAMGQLGVLIGRPKAGKSYLALDLARSLDTGDAWLGRQVQPARVLFLALEDGQRRLRDRIVGMSWQPQRVDFAFALLPLDGQGGAGDGVAQLELLTVDYDVIIIDTLVAGLSAYADENNNVAMATILQALADVAHATNTLILLVHHTRKLTGGDDPFLAARGASAIRGAYDVGLAFERKVGEDAAVLHTESRDGDSPTLGLRQIADTMRWQVIGDEYAVEELRSERRTLAALEKIGDGATTAEIAQAAEVARTTALRHLQALEKGGFVEREKGSVGRKGGRPTDTWALGAAFRHHGVAQGGLNL